MSQFVLKPVYDTTAGTAHANIEIIGLYALQKQDPQ